MKRPLQSRIRRHSTFRRPPSAFTLVELLVVITIIGILAGLVTAAAIRARIAARRAAITIDISQLDAALKAYKEKFGEYPPDFDAVDSTTATVKTAAQNVILRHLARAFPRLVIPGATQAAQWSNLQTTIKNNWGVDINAFGGHAALMFWLGGMPTWSGAIGTSNVTGFIGFSANSLDPFDASPSRTGPFFDFDLSRTLLTFPVAGSSVLQYYPPGVTGNNADNSYVYFRAENGHYTVEGNPLPPPAVIPPLVSTLKQYSTANTVVVPAEDSRLSPASPSPASPYVWINPKSFQIFCAGMDAQYSPAGKLTSPLQFPTGGNYQPQNFDDMTNFGTGTLEDSIPP